MPPKRAKTATTAAPAPATRSTRSTRAAAATSAVPAPTKPEKTKITRPGKGKSTAKARAKTVEADVDADVDVEVEIPSSAKQIQQHGGSAEEARMKADKAAQEEEYRMVDEVLQDVERMGEEVEVADVQGSPEAEPVEVQELERTPKPIPRTRQTRLGARPPRTVKKAVQSEANRKALEGLRKRMEEDARRLRGSPDPRPDVEEPAPERRSTTPPPAPATVQRAAAVPGTTARAPQSALKVQSTPGVENSILALANFRRRPRQPSLLQMVQGKGLDADPEDDTTDFTLGTDLEDSVEGLEGFKPYDESTPLQVSKAPVLPQTHATPEPETQQDAEDDDDLYGATPLQSPSRKRKSDALETENEATQIQVRRSVSSSRHSSPGLPQDPSDDFEAIPATHPDSSLSPYPDDQPEDPMSDTLADPLSSSPPPYPSSNLETQQQPRPPASPHLRKTAPRHEKDTRNLKPLTTATLRAMLPKRRVRRILREDREDFSIPSSSSIEERSSSHETVAAKKRASVAKKRAPASKPGSLSPISSRKTQGSKKKAPAETAKAVKKTYTRLSGANKENAAVVGSSSPLSSVPLTGSDAEDDETADTSLETIGRTTAKTGKRVVSSELQAAKSKFDEVDDWEMEFESASVGVGGESSPWR